MYVDAAFIFLSLSARNGAYHVFHPKIPHLADHFDPGGLDLLLSRSVVISHDTVPIVILHQRKAAPLK